MITLLIVIELSVHTNSQANIGCLNAEGKIVDWFVINTTPQSVHNSDPDSGFLYFDNTFKTGKFNINPGYGNEDENPIGRTAAQIEQFNLQNAAWNDQFDTEWDRGKGDSKKAHAKSYMATTSDNFKGFFMDHSVPNYSTVIDGRVFTYRSIFWYATSYLTLLYWSLHNR